MKIIIMFVFINTAMSSEILTFDEIKIGQAGPKRISAKSIIKKKERKKVKSENLKNELEDTKQKLEAYRYMAKMQLKKPYILKSEVVGEGSFIGASTTLSVMATNTATTILVSDLRGIDLPDSATISCQVIAKYKRVCGVCNRLIIDGIGIDIEADLKNKDGQNCALGKVLDNDEKYLTGVFLSEAAQGALAISQGSISTPLGTIVENSAKNKISQALTNTGSAATEILLDKYKTQEPIVIIPKGERVIVQFRKRVEI